MEDEAKKEKEKRRKKVERGAGVCRLEGGREGQEAAKNRGGPAHRHEP